MSVGQIIRDLTEAINRGEYPSEKQKKMLILKVKELSVTSPREANILEDALGRLGIARAPCAKEQRVEPDEREEVETTIGTDRVLDWLISRDKLIANRHYIDELLIRHESDVLLRESASIGNDMGILMKDNLTFSGKLARGEIGEDDMLLEYGWPYLISSNITAYASRDPRLTLTALYTVVGELEFYEKIAEIVTEVCSNDVIHRTIIRELGKDNCSLNDEEKERLSMALWDTYMYRFYSITGDNYPPNNISKWMELILALENTTKHVLVEQMTVHPGETFQLLTECKVFRDLVEELSQRDS